MQSDFDYFMQIYYNICVKKLGLAFCSTQLSIQVSKSIASSKHPCHTWDFGLETPYEVVSPCSQRLRLHRLISNDLGLKT